MVSVTTGCQSTQTDWTGINQWDHRPSVGGHFPSDLARQVTEIFPPDEQPPAIVIKLPVDLEDNTTAKRRPGNQLDRQGTKPAKPATQHSGA